MDLVEQARLIGLDWGSTSVRAFLFDELGGVLDARTATQGASTLRGAADFELALEKLCGSWISGRPGTPLVACGMVGSQHGWREAPYVDGPAGLDQLAARSVRVESHDLTILPGLRYDADMPDVMRGEETQILGALSHIPELAQNACFVLPGTHSKWVSVRKGRIESFATYMTGELFDLLRYRSVLARLMPEDGGVPSPEAFSIGVGSALNGDERGLTNLIFSARTLGLFGRLQSEDLPDYLSGLLVGHEVAAAMRTHRREAAPIVLIGEPALCKRYSAALTLHNADAYLCLDNTAPAGLWHLARVMEMLD